MVVLAVAKRWTGSAWVDLTLGGGGLLSATASPSAAIGAVTNSSLFTNVTSNSVTVTPTGGTGPYTYFWVKTSGNSAPVPSSYTAASVTFSANVARDNEYTSTYKCVVTDSLLAVTEVTGVSVHLIHNSTL